MCVRVFSVCSQSRHTWYFSHKYFANNLIQILECDSCSSGQTAVRMFAPPWVTQNFNNFTLFVHALCNERNFIFIEIELYFQISYQFRTVILIESKNWSIIKFSLFKFCLSWYVFYRFYHVCWCCYQENLLIMM